MMSSEWFYKASLTDQHQHNVTNNNLVLHAVLLIYFCIIYLCVCVCVCVLTKQKKNFLHPGN